MTKIILFAGIFVSTIVYSQEVSVGKIDTAQDTTISIKKGAHSDAKKKYSVVEGEHEVVGDKDVVAKSAEKNWKAACTEWKKEFREDNKDNKIISVTCGRMVCEKVGVESTCQSQAKFKIKTLAEE